MSTLRVNKRILWTCSLGFSLFALISIIVMWSTIHLVYKGDPNEISTKKKLSQYVNQFETQHHAAGKSIYIPTGLFLTAFYFIDPHTISISGFIWQKIPKTALKNGIKPGISFAEANQFPRFNQVYKRDYPDYILMGWEFWGVSLYEKFDYAKYPFDIQPITIRIWHIDYHDNILLIPDLDAYPYRGFEEVYGIGSRTPLKGFKLIETYFSYAEEKYNTNFGFYESTMKANDLYFNIVVQRTFIDSFMLHLMPVLVVWAILFGLTMVMSSDVEKAKIFNFSTTGTLSALGASFFSILIAQIGLRNNFLGSPLTYLEYFYVVTYILIFLLALNAYLTTPRKDIPQWLAWENNLIPKILFWPYLLGTLAIATYLRFFMK